MKTAIMTQKEVDAILKQAESGQLSKAKKFFVGGVAGLFLLVNRKSASFCYRTRQGGKETSFIIGKAAEMSVSAARQKTKQLKAQLNNISIENKVERLKIKREKRIESKIISQKTIEEKVSSDFKILHKQKEIDIKERSFSYFLEKYMEIKIEGKSESTISHYRRWNRKALAKIGKIPVSELKPTDVENFLINEIGEFERKKVLFFLRDTIEYAVHVGALEHQILSEFFMKSIKAYKGKNIPAPAFNEYPQKLEEAISKCSTDIQKIFIVFLQLLPIRSVEAENLRWKDISFLDSRIYVYQSKTKKVNLLPMNRLVQAFLRPLYQKAEDKENGLVFDGLKRDTIKHKLASVDKFSAHSARSIFETEMLNENELKEDCEKILGHIKDKYNNSYDRADLLERKENILNKWHEALVFNSTINKILTETCPTPKENAFWPSEFLERGTSRALFCEERARWTQSLHDTYEKDGFPSNTDYE